MFVKSNIGSPSGNGRHGVHQISLFCHHVGYDRVKEVFGSPVFSLWRILFCSLYNSRSHLKYAIAYISQSSIYCKIVGRLIALISLATGVKWRCCFASSLVGFTLRLESDDGLGQRQQGSLTDAVTLCWPSIVVLRQSGRSIDSLLTTRPQLRVVSQLRGRAWRFSWVKSQIFITNEPQRI